MKICITKLECVNGCESTSQDKQQSMCGEANWRAISAQESSTLHWWHNGCDDISNHQPHHCLLKRLFRHRSKKTSKLRVTGLCAGNSPVTGEFPAQMASNAENVSIWWRHHVARLEYVNDYEFTPQDKLQSMCGEASWRAISAQEANTLQWYHNGCDGISNHQPHHYLLNHLFRRRSKKTSKLCVTGLCVGNSPVTCEFPTQRTSSAENVSIWWRHHVTRLEYVNDCESAPQSKQQSMCGVANWRAISAQEAST